MATVLHKEELQRRILERRAALAITLERLRSDAQTVGRAQFRAVEEAIAVLDMHLASGWDRVDEVEAAELSHWLDSTEHLTQPASAAAG